MKQTTTTSYFAEGHQTKILGINEKTAYRLGVVIFYIILFLAVSVISNKYPAGTSQIKKELKSE